MNERVPVLYFYPSCPDCGVESVPYRDVARRHDWSYTCRSPRCPYRILTGQFLRFRTSDGHVLRWSL